MNDTDKSDIQERIHALRREADQLECQMRGIELGVFLFEKQHADKVKRIEAAMHEREACAKIADESAEPCECAGQIRARTTAPPE